MKTHKKATGLQFSALFKKVGFILTALTAFVCSSFAQSGLPLLDSAKAYKGISAERSLAFARRAMVTPNITEDQKAGVLLFTGRLFGDLAQYDSALIYLRRANKSFRALNNNKGIADALDGIGYAYEYQNKQKLAIENYQAALSIYRTNSFPTEAVQTILHIGNAQVKQKKLPNARSSYALALDKAKATKDNKLIVTCYESLIQISEQMKDFKKALMWQRQLESYRMSVQREQYEQQIQTLNKKFEDIVEQKDEAKSDVEEVRQQLASDREAVINEQKYAQTIFIAVASSLLLITLILLYFMLRIRRKARKQAARHEKEIAILMADSTQFMSLTADIQEEFGGKLNELEVLGEQLTQNKSREEMISGAETIRGRSENLVQDISEIIWSINPKNQSLQSFVAYIREQTNAILKPMDIKFMLVMPDPVPDVRLTSLQRRNLLHVTRWLVREVQHANPTGVTLSMTLERGGMMFKLKVTSANGTLNGKQTVHEIKKLQVRMEEIGGTLSLQNEAGNSTIYIYSLPIIF